MVVRTNCDANDEEGTDLLFRALADPIRRNILRRAHEGRLSVSALAREHPISVTAMQKHVAVLERAELVTKHRVGRESIVQTRADALERARATLDRLTLTITEGSTPTPSASGRESRTRCPDESGSLLRGFRNRDF